MNLLMISGDRSIPVGRKGAFWYTLEELSKHWDRIDVICPSIRNTKYEILDTCSSVRGNVYFHPSPWRLWHQPWWILKKGRELIAAHQHEVMTVHEYPPFYNGIGAAFLHAATEIPFALEVHHIIGHPKVADVTEAVGRFLSRWWLPLISRRARGVRVVNEGVKRPLIRWGIAEDALKVVPSFYLDRDLFDRIENKPKDYDLVVCARLVANKNIGNVLKAVSQLPNVRLLVIGDGPLRQSLESESQHLGISNRVTFAGWLESRQDVVAALKSAKVFVMNSLSEGGPRAALEALAAGLPVVSTQVGVMPDVIEDGSNGVFTTGEPADLTAKISTLLADQSQQARMGSEARKILDRFERTQLIEGYAEFLKSCVS